MQQTLIRTERLEPPSINICKDAILIQTDNPFGGMFECWIPPLFFSGKMAFHPRRMSTAPTLICGFSRFAHILRLNDNFDTYHNTYFAITKDCTQSAHIMSTLPHSLPYDSANKLAFSDVRSGGPLKLVPNRSNSGRWEKWERILFLQGLRLHGRGKWTKISEMISTR